VPCTRRGTPDHGAHHRRAGRHRPEIAIRAAWALREQANCVLVGDAAFLALTASLIDPASAWPPCRPRRCATAACRISARSASP
jgi:hypothetical protein